jgi:hypothetical protein
LAIKFFETIFFPAHFSIFLAYQLLECSLEVRIWQIEIWRLRISKNIHFRHFEKQIAKKITGGCSQPTFPHPDKAKL